uniref:Uncharacterized protein n=1 Tax=Rhipicephalus zambeziensis TaxID=60191 RepID=A0A224YFF2_9ACAR
MKKTMVVSLESFSESLLYFIAQNNVLGKLSCLQVVCYNGRSILSNILSLFFLFAKFILFVITTFPLTSTYFFCVWLLKTSSVAEVYYMRHIHYWASGTQREAVRKNCSR